MNDDYGQAFHDGEASGAGFERRDVIAFLRKEASRIRERAEGSDEAVAAHFDIVADQIDRGEHTRGDS